MSAGIGPGKPMKGRLLYFGTDDKLDVEEAICVIGGALHYAALHVEDFRDYVMTDPANVGFKPPPPERVLQSIELAHSLASPSCKVPVEAGPPAPSEGPATWV